MPMFYAKKVPESATHYVACADDDGCDLFMRRDPQNPKEWQGFFGTRGIWSDVVTNRPIQDLPFWALNPGEAEVKARVRRAQEKLELNIFYGLYGGITACPRAFFHDLATHGQAATRITLDPDQTLDAAVDKLKQATDELVKARDAKPRVRVSAVCDPLCFDESGSISEQALGRIYRKEMTPKANGTPYRMFIDGGWTDAQLIEHGYMRAPMTVRQGMPEAGTKPLNQPSRPLAKLVADQREKLERIVKFQTARNLELQQEAKKARESRRLAEKYTEKVKLCHLNVGDSFMVPEDNMSLGQRLKWCSKLLTVVNTQGVNPSYTKGGFGLYGVRQNIRAMDLDTLDVFEMPHLSTLVWRC